MVVGLNDGAAGAYWKYLGEERTLVAFTGRNEAEGVV